MFTWRRRSKTTRLILHDSHTPATLPSATAHMRTKGRAMGLLEVGYHWVLERDGELVVTRHHALIGSHTPGHNGDSLGLCLAGNHETPFTYDQMSRLAELWEELGLIYDSPPLKLLGHSEVQRYKNRPHDCPALDMDALREELGATHGTA